MKYLPILFAVVLAAGASHAALPYTPPPDTPVLISDFETQDSVAQWQGDIPHSFVQNHATHGTGAMTFSIPKWSEGKEERPGVTLKFDEGKGFPFKDFTRYGKLVVDVWVEGAAPGKMGLKTRDRNGINSWTAHITVEPGKVNHAELLMSDAVEDSDMANVSEIVLYALRPDSSFQLTVDNLRLLPVESTPTPGSFALLHPNYRNMLLPGDRYVEVEASLALSANGLKADQAEVALTGDNTVETHTKYFRPTEADGVNRFRLPIKRFSSGPLSVCAQLVDRKANQVIVQQEWKLSKLSKAEAAKLTVYVDAHNNIVCDGKPYFPLGWYGSAKDDQINEVGDSPFNCMILYGGADRAFMDKMQSKGLKLLNCLMYTPDLWKDDFGKPSAAAKRLQETRDHPALLGWYLNDEIPRERVRELEDHLQRVRTADPYHPALSVLCNRKDFKHLAHTADIFGWDHYPVPTESLATIPAFMDSSNRAVHNAKPVWAVIQAFGWYQYRPPNGNRGRTPTAEELLKGRAPTYDEVRCMTYLALARGAKGIFYYCYYDLKVLPQYAEMWPWLKKIGGEVKTLSPVLLSPDDRGEATVTPADSPVRTRVIGYGGRVYLLAVNESEKPVEAGLQVNGAGKTGKVLFEDRTVTFEKGNLTGSFKGYEAHVYEIE